MGLVGLVNFDWFVSVCLTSPLPLRTCDPTRSVELNASGAVLSDEEKVPDAVVTVVLVRLPWLGASEDRVKDLGGGEFEIVGEEKKLG